ncbi:hypothetical protein GR168_13690 [Gordonia sp. JH63]|uniref:DUF1844 domain-containing protein n=1 Tax=Gordonia hongkongensis TaxID=1701090 RepID=A0AAX3T2D5_9ACTN|nr:MULTISPECIES: DUF1844 domain-containing protein [Gordonia]MCZ4536044.1 DUF1844 domain-containing protein [Gordonia terrae]KSU52089.1 hypothetical protein AS181_23475 [Gordonia sp. SGD-V-85]MBN0974724.1 hypothetical protein [Gordonia sp. BP-119]MBN0984760.1 hypothetical protein [Gordonia sp. BP-94]MBR7194943.1 hypothetical protein [Gordonia sp. SCSIO 19800]
MAENSYSSPAPLPPEGATGDGADLGDAAHTDPDNVRDLGDIPAIEVITRSIVMLMSAAAEKLGLAEGTPADRIDLPEARTLITALAGIVDASKADLGIHAAPIRDGLKGLQLAFREASAYPDEPGEGPGEKYTGPVRAPRR